ncbi:gallidermin/nisin family lantibiotic [Staphylococcus gallinarum]|nr:gallidermin/nisin family lantibiotic [Staphylococcus gallinarum]MEB6296571.1 gallidermin/nisin family lantibiotic [Staphylococcus gallinarum]
MNSQFNLSSKSVSVSGSKNNNLETRITSVSLCTPGCVTGSLQGCNNKTSTCKCSGHIHVHTK